jgi:lipid-binding SYLF domain-containing protein
MKYQTHFFNKLVAAVFVMALISMVSYAQNNKEKDRIAKCEETKAAFIKSNEKMEDLFKKAYGYAIFPGIGKGAVGVGGAHGDGVLYKKGKPVSRASMSQVTVGFQLGGQSYMEAVMFQDERAYNNFVEGKLKLAAQASAVAVTEGASLDAPYNDGVGIFTMVKGGLMYEASVGGQKFSVNEWKN